MYINDSTQEQKTYNAIKADNPNVSMPVNGTEVLIDIWYFINPTAQGSYNPDIETWTEDPPAKTGEVYNQVWLLTPLTQQEMDDNLANAQTRKIAEIDNYADDLVADAYNNPVQGETIDGIRYRKQVGTRTKNKSDKMAGEIALDQEEKDQSKTDQKLAEYEVKAGTDDANKAVTNMYKLDLPSEVNAFDVAAESWTVWNPPI